MAVDDVAWANDWDEFDHILEASATISLSGTVAGEATEEFTTTITHSAFSDVFTQTFVSQSAAGYTGYEEGVPPQFFVYIPATGTGVPTPGAQANISVENDDTVTTIKVQIRNPTTNTWTLTTNTLTFRYVVTDVPWDTPVEVTDYRVTSGGDSRVTSGGDRRVGV